MATRAQGEVPGKTTAPERTGAVGASREPPGPNPPATAGATGNAEPSALEPDVDAFLRESPRALTGHYWDPVDSLVPVRLLDMRDEPAPAEPRRTIRGMDLVIGAVGVAAVGMLALSVFKSAPLGAAVAAHASTERGSDGVTAAHAIKERAGNAPSATRGPSAKAETPLAVGAPPPAVPTPPPAEAPQAVAVSAPLNAATTAAPAARAETPPASTPSEPVGGKAESPPLGRSAEPGAATVLAVAAEAKPSTPDVAAPPPLRPKKRRPKPSKHAPPTASFPD